MLLAQFIFSEECHIFLFIGNKSRLHEKKLLRSWADDTMISTQHVQRAIMTKECWPCEILVRRTCDMLCTCDAGMPVKVITGLWQGNDSHVAPHAPFQLGVLIVIFITLVSILRIGILFLPRCLATRLFIGKSA